MLDATLFNVSLPEVSVGSKKTLVLSGCRVKLTQDQPYSEFEELTFYSMNNNDYGCGKAEIELFFDNRFSNPYFKFYMQCITIRTNSKLLIKSNINTMSNVVLEHRYSKVTKDGKVSFGLGYFFRTEKERQMLRNSESFCVEGFIAIGRKRNVYGFVCQMRKRNGEWILTDGNTYKIYKRTNIQTLAH